jgi:hypothetical protein
MKSICISTVEYLTPNGQIALAVPGSRCAPVDRQINAALLSPDNHSLLYCPIEVDLAQTTITASADQLDDLRFADVVQVVVSTRNTVDADGLDAI